MANNIGWGQGVINNIIGWGQGAINNVISWGSIYADSYSGETNILGDGIDIDARITENNIIRVTENNINRIIE